MFAPSLLVFRSLLRALLIALTVFGIVCPAVAQSEPTPADVEAEATAEEAVQVPPELTHARAAVRTFLEAFDPAKRPEDVHPLDRAAMTLNLSDIAENLRKSQGRELAAELKQIIDRTVYIDFAAIPARPEGDPWILPVLGADGQPIGQLVVAPDAIGRWRFTIQTVESIPEILRAVTDLEIVEGVTHTGPLTPAMWVRAKLPAGLLQAPFLLENWQWMALFLLMVLGTLTDRLVVAAVHATVQRYLTKRMEALEPVALRKALRPVGWFAMALIWWPGVLWMGLPPHILKVLVVVIQFVAITAAVWATYRTVDIVALVLEVRATRSTNKFDDLLVPLFRKSAKLFVAALGFVFIADNLQIEITSLVAGLGIGGLALALAAQDTVKNLFGSLTVIIDQPFSIGDWVQVGDIEGTVVELGFRSTRIRTFYDSVVTLPNANLINASVDNYGRRQYRRWSTTLSLTYGTPPEKIEAFCEGVRELIRTHEHTRKDAFHVYLNAFSSSSLDVLLYVFFDCKDWSIELQAKQRLAIDILRLGRDLGVDFAFPTQTIHMANDEEEAGVPPFDSYSAEVQKHLEGARQHARALAASTGKPGPATAVGEGFNDA